MLIVNAHVLDPFTGLDDYKDIRINEGKITEVAKASTLTAVSEEECIDASGLVLLPGFIDVHVHFRDPGFTYKEDIFSGAKVAARGGFTKVVLMANTKPVVDNCEILKYVLDKGAETDINVLSCASVTKGLAGMELTDFEQLVKCGAAGFTDDGIPLMNVDLLKEAFLKAKELNMPISLHEEDKSYISENGINAGKASEHYGIKGSPSIAEYSLVKRDTDLAIETGVTLDIQHISTKEAVDIVRKAKGKNSRIFAEVTPHHIAATEDAVIEYGSNAKMNPPLRTAADREAIIEGIKDGTIEIIATDHAPHSSEEKSGDIVKTPSGIIGLESAFSVAYENLVEAGHISLMQLAKMFTVGPSTLYNMKDGAIKVGNPADMVLIDTDSKWKYDYSLSKSSNTMFLGRELHAQVVKTICKGKVVYEKV